MMDAIKEGDGTRLMQCYKVVLLFEYKFKHTKYAYILLKKRKRFCEHCDRVFSIRTYNQHKRSKASHAADAADAQGIRKERIIILNRDVCKQTAKVFLVFICIGFYLLLLNWNEDDHKQYRKKKDGDWYIYPQFLVHENPKNAHKIAQKSSKNFKPGIHNVVSTGTNFWLSDVPFGCVRFARYCDKMYCLHLCVSLVYQLITDAIFNISR